MPDAKENKQRLIDEAAERCGRVEENSRANRPCWISDVYATEPTSWHDDLRTVAAAYNELRAERLYGKSIIQLHEDAKRYKDEIDAANRRLDAAGIPAGDPIASRVGAFVIQWNEITVRNGALSAQVAQQEREIATMRQQLKIPHPDRDIANEANAVIQAQHTTIERQTDEIGRLKRAANIFEHNSAGAAAMQDTLRRVQSFLVSLGNGHDFNWYEVNALKADVNRWFEKPVVDPLVEARAEIERAMTQRIGGSMTVLEFFECTAKFGRITSHDQSFVDWCKKYAPLLRAAVALAEKGKD